MPLPSLSQVHIDQLLTNISVAYRQNSDHYIASKAAPSISVSKKSDLYRIYTKNDWFRDDMQLLAPGTEAVEAGYNLTTGQFNCRVHALGKMIDDQERANYDQPGDIEADSTEYLTQKAMIHLERQWSSAFFSTGIWDTDVTLVGPDQWSDPVGSDPKADVQAGMATVLTNTGFEPNSLIVGYEVHQALQRHPLVRDQFKYTSAESINEQMLARFFEVDQYLVCKAVTATNAENAADAMSLIQGKNALLAYVAPRPSLMLPSAMYSFVWTGLGMNNLGMKVLNIPIPEKHGNKIELQLAFDNKVVAADLGYFLADVVA